MNTRPDTTGLHDYIYHTHTGTPVECYFGYTPADRGEYGESLDLVHAFVGDTDILEMMSPTVKGFIETVALAKFQKDRREESNNSKIESYRSNRDYSNFFGCGRLA